MFRPSANRRGAAVTALCAATLVFSWIGPAPALAGPGSAAAGQVPAISALAGHEIHTVRTGPRSVAVYVDGAQRTTVGLSDPAYTVRTALSQDARTAALILDFTGRAGSELRLLAVASGETRTVARGEITSAAFSADGRLAYLRLDGSVLTYSGTAGSTARGTLTGHAPELVGWTSDGAGLLVQHRDATAMTPSLSRFDLATGALAPVLTSDPAAGVVYRDFRVTTQDGVQRVTAIRATHSYPCAGRDSALVLADERGAVLRTLGTTTDSYRSAIWSSDGRWIAYELQACVSVKQKASDRGAALDRVSSVNGVYVLDRATGRSHRVVRGLSRNFPLTGLAAGTVRLASDRLGMRTAAAGAVDALAADRLDAAADGGASIQAKIFPSNFIHQLWDTADDFNGNSACGPTSAVMDLAGYQLASEFGLWASWPYGHWSPYGGYISRVYSAYGTTYNAYAPDPNWNWFAGAYGWMVDDPNVGTIHYWLTDYLDRHVSYPIAQASNPSGAWIRAQIDANLMVVVSGNFVYGRYGHIALITGYTDDGRFYVNDPYGAGTDGSYDGKNTIYTLDYMRGWAFWAA